MKVFAYSACLFMAALCISCVVPIIYEDPPATEGSGFEISSDGTLLRTPANRTGHLDVPEGVLSISSYAFYYGQNLTSIHIPSSVSNITTGAFSECSSLLAISVATDNSNYTSIDGVLFDKAQHTLLKYPEAKLGTSYVVPQSVTLIKYSAFKSSDAIAEVQLPTGLIEIEDSAFARCTGLTSLSIPDSVTTIGSGAFADCTNIATIVLPAELTTIESGLFYHCEKLTTIAIPQTIESIGESAFSRCYSLTSVSIPASVASLGYGAFSYCTSLLSATLEPGLLITGRGTFSGCTALTSVSIPSSITTIDDGFMSGCTALPGITLPTSLRYIGRDAFYACSKISSVTIPPSVLGIGEEAFSNCSDLQTINVDGANPHYQSQSGVLYNKAASILIRAPMKLAGAFTVPGTVNFVESRAFSWCKNLTSITFPASVTQIGDDILYNGGDALTSIVMESDTPPMLPYFGSLGSYNQVFEVRVPAGKVLDYKTAQGWSRYANRIVSM